jgi:AmiR/NasT family two-component response regulator
VILAAHASTALAGTVAATAAELETAQLRQALQSRDVIGQAKGILMERRGISADEAFDVLRRASQSLNIKLTTVAQTLVDRRAEI